MIFKMAKTFFILTAISYFIFTNSVTSSPIPTSLQPTEITLIDVDNDNGTTTTTMSLSILTSDDELVNDDGGDVNSTTQAPTSLWPTEITIFEVENDNESTTALSTLASDDELANDDGGDDNSTTTSSQVMISGVIVDSEVNASKVEILKAHLEQFGYIPLGSVFGDAIINYTSAILRFQEYGGINQTGILDADTSDLLDTPRCGVPDTLPYVTSSITWPNNRPITYSFETLTTDLDENDVKSEIARAFQVWDEVSGLTFEEVADGQGVDIRIKFSSREHGDGIAFDGLGGVLAHAFLPRNGDAHFDDDERWTMGTRSGKNLFQVAAHEFGHSLGLYHSRVPSALMYPYYRGYIQDYTLDSDDIAGIRSLYGGNSDTTTTTATTTSEPTTTHRITTQTTTQSSTTTAAPTTTPTTTQAATTTTAPTTTIATTTRRPAPIPPRRACSGSFDAVIKANDGSVYALTGPYFWELDETAPSWGLVSNQFGFGLPENIDASFQIGLYSYFFSECFYYYRTATQRNYPKVATNRRWVGLPCNIDAVYRARRGATFFFKGEFVFKFSSNNQLRRRTRISTLFRNVPAALHDGIEAAVRVDNTYVHFYRNGRYYRMRDSNKLFVNFPDGSPYRNVIDTLIPQCNSLPLRYESDEDCSNSSE